ncbi:DUF3455 domain-containing protein [Bosea sp. LjRoot90]|uniref:DUF3455 domain-containing protein n=1 Tax=Bosea sp. LjRoot90 TaxID=3342342 RepID=UPI003ECC4DC6
MTEKNLAAASAHVPRIAAILSGVIAAAAILAGGHVAAAELPGAIAAPGRTEILNLHAEGVQIYECKVNPTGDVRWQFREPLALLLKDGKTVGRHFAGPSWELASGSTVVGKVEAQAPGRTSSDIALLKLAAVEKRDGGELAKVVAIQRLETRGGAFGGPCERPGAFHLDPYSADYVFLGE